MCSILAYLLSWALRFTVSDTTGSEILCKALITILSGTDTVPIVSVNALYRNLDIMYFVEKNESQQEKKILFYSDQT
jgi:hypothetical protein